MSPRPAATAFATAIVLALAVSATASATDAAKAKEATATLKAPDGRELGRATLTQTPNGVLVSAQATGLSAGPHAFHVHETGGCDGSEGFKSAGGHFALDHQHGYLVEAGPHPGDMPNVYVQEDGVFRVEYVNTRVSLQAGDKGYLFDDDGSALVIHAKGDDYRSQPSGDAGDRIACGVIETR